MRTVQGFNDYEILDAGNGEKLERWGDILLIRPDPQVIWSTDKTKGLWQQAHARYHRSSSGGGYWETYKKVPDVWSVKYKDLTFRLKPMGFKHTGLFPEQSVNWDAMSNAIKNAGRPVSVLNLFAYTGGATVACLKAGASVTHVDASKGMVGWAKENAAASGVADRSVRWLVDDCMKFVAREIRRGRKYDGIVMDPPSYGRGPDGEVWKLEQQLESLLDSVAQILSEDPVFFLLNSYTTGVSPSILKYMVQKQIVAGKKGTFSADEIGIPITGQQVCLPCGNTTMWIRDTECGK